MNERRILKSLLAFALSGGLLLCLCSCPGKEPDSTVVGGPTYSPEDCPHMTVVDAAVEPTCTEEGKTPGSRCIGCGTIFEAQQIVPPLGHDYHDGVCTRCGAEEQ